MQLQVRPKSVYIIHVIFRRERFAVSTRRVVRLLSLLAIPEESDLRLFLTDYLFDVSCEIDSSLNYWKTA